MGGMYHPIAQGQIDGHKQGLESDLSIDEFARNIKFKNFHSDYWIGFGAGYKEGQTLRNNIKKLAGALSFAEYIQCCQYLFWKTQICRTSPQDYVDNIENWDKLEIDLNVCQKSLKFLCNNQIQRGLIEIFEFYKTNFRVKALREIDLLLQELKEIRDRKKKENNYDTREAKEKLILTAKSFINTNEQQEKE